jgi:hypothetical protein
MKVLSDPRIQKVMMRALRMPSDIRLAIEKNGQNLAKTFALVTKEDLINMKRTMRELQSELVRLKSELEAANSAPAEAPAPAETPAPGNGSAAAATAEAPAKPKRKVTVKKKKVTIKRKSAAKKK